MQLNGFDEFILKIPGAKTNTFVKEDCEKHKIWGILLPIIAVTPLSLIGLIIGLVIFLTKKDESDYIKYLFNQNLWLFILGFVNIIPLVGQLLWLCVIFLAVVCVYGNVTGKYFDLPLVGGAKIIKY